MSDTQDQDNSVISTGPGEYSVGINLLYAELQREYAELRNENRTMVLVLRAAENTIAELQKRNGELETLSATLAKKVEEQASKPPVEQRRTRGSKS